MPHDFAAWMPTEDLLSTDELMTILEVGDATEAETVLDVAHKVDGPVYIRMLRGEVSRIFPKDEPFIFNTARILSTGTDITLITSGIMTEEALRAIPLLQERGVSISHLHVSTMKPFTDPFPFRNPEARTSIGEVRSDNQRPATLAIAKEIKAAFLTALADANPLATSRIGPTLFSSVPLMPSL